MYMFKKTNFSGVNFNSDLKRLVAQKLCSSPTVNCHYPWIGMCSLRCGGSLAAQVISVAGIPRATETKRDTRMSIMCDFPSLCFFFLPMISFYLR